MSDRGMRRSEPLVRSLGHPTRVRILRCLLDIGTATPARLAAELRMPVPRVSLSGNQQRQYLIVVAP